MVTRIRPEPDERHGGDYRLSRVPPRVAAAAARPPRVCTRPYRGTYVMGDTDSPVCAQACRTRRSGALLATALLGVARITVHAPVRGSTGYLLPR